MLGDADREMGSWIMFRIMVAIAKLAFSFRRVCSWELRLRTAGLAEEDDRVHCSKGRRRVRDGLTQLALRSRVHAGLGFTGTGRVRGLGCAHL